MARKSLICKIFRFLLLFFSRLAPQNAALRRFCDFLDFERPIPQKIALPVQLDTTACRVPPSCQTFFCTIAFRRSGYETRRLVTIDSAFNARLRLFAVNVWW